MNPENYDFELVAVTPPKSGTNTGPTRHKYAMRLKNTKKSTTSAPKPFAPLRQMPKPSVAPPPSATPSRPSVAPASPMPRISATAPPAGNYPLTGVRESPKPAVGPPRRNASSILASAGAAAPAPAPVTSAGAPAVVPNVVPLPNVIHRNTRRRLTNQNAARMLAERATSNSFRKPPILVMPKPPVRGARPPSPTTVRRRKRI